MIKNSEQEIKFDSINLLFFLLKKWKSLFLITTIGAIISIIVALIIEPRYESIAVIFPASQSSISKELLTDMSRAPKNILKFGEEEEAEQLLQILYSDIVKQRIAAKYQLLSHYDIDLESNYPITKLYKQYDENISFRRTEYMSIEIKVLDKDPQIAADIANDISALLDTVYNKMQKDRAREALRIVTDEYDRLEKQVKVYEDSLTSLRRLGVFDYESQASSYSDAYANALSVGNQSGISKIKEDLKVLAEYGGAYVSVRDFLGYAYQQLSMLRAKAMEAKVDVEQNFPHKYVVNQAYKAEKKAKPVRWLIVVLSTFSTFLLALFVLIILDNLKKFDLQKIQSN